MATSIKSKHFAGFNRSGHHTPAQFRDLVQDLLECPAVNSINSSAFDSGTGGRVVRRMVPTETGMVLTVQANGLRQTYIVFTDQPDEVTALLRDKHGFVGGASPTSDSSPFADTDSEGAVDTTEQRVLPDLSWLSSPARRLDNAERGVLAALVSLANPHTGWLPRNWGGQDALDAIRDALERKHTDDAISAALDTLTADGRVHLDAHEARVLVPLDGQGRIVLPQPLPSPEEVLAEQPPLSEADLRGDEDRAWTVIEGWADTQVRDYLDAGVPSYIRPFLRDGMLDAAATWMQQAKDNLPDQTEDTDDDLDLDALRAVLRRAPKALTRLRKEQSVAVSSTRISELAVLHLERQANLLREQIAVRRHYQTALNLMKEVVSQSDEQETA